MAERLTARANAIATDANALIPDHGDNGFFSVQNQQLTRTTLWALAATTLAFGLAYAPNFRELQSVWNSDPNYSHGYLIIPIALFILWRRLSEIPATAPRSTVLARWWGWIILGAVLALRAIAYERGTQWVENVTLLPVIACLTWTFGGWPLVRRVWPAIAFLTFLFPLPPGVNDSVALPLQRVAATGSGFLLQLSGLWAVQQGNVIQLRTPHGVIPLDVALACNGLRMLMTMAATITATIIIIPLPTWKRVVLLASTIPIALLSNMIRIVATGWCYYVFEGPKAKEWAHDVSGWMMMPLALALVGLELRLLSWLATDTIEDENDNRSLILPTRGEKASGKNAQKNADLDELS